MKLGQTLEDRVRIIRASFEAAIGLTLLEVSGSFRVDFDTGQTVYIYVETYDNDITVRFETKNQHPESRHQEVETIRNRLVRELCFADISEFKEASAAKNRFVYTADVQMDESIFFHETIVIGSDEAVAVTQDKSSAPGVPGEPAPGKKPSAESLSLAEKAIDGLENIDAKMLRQSLDMMNLKRSSNVRLVLTRIFRDAVDPEELVFAVQSEAGKLTASKDHEDLKIIKAINQDSFLEPIISLLYEEVFGEEEGSS